LVVLEHCAGVAVSVEVREGRDPGKAILEAARDLDPILLLIGWSGEVGPRRYLLGSILDPVTRYAPCDVVVIRADDVGQVRRALVPVGGGPNATLALELALLLGVDVRVTALNIARDTLGPIGVAAGYEQLRGLLKPWADDPRVTPKVVSASNVIGGILSEAAAGYDIILIGASNESYIDRQLFGNVPQTVAAQSIAPTVIVRRRAGPVRSILRRVERWFLALQ
jgi:nucleotide-binding universal stress UspA family protein